MDSQVPFFSIMVARISCWFLVLMLILPNRLQSETTSEIFTFSRTPHVSTVVVLVMEMMMVMMMMMMDEDEDDDDDDADADDDGDVHEE